MTERRIAVGGRVISLASLAFSLLDNARGAQSARKHPTRRTRPSSTYPVGSFRAGSRVGTDFPLRAEKTSIVLSQRRQPKGRLTPHKQPIAGPRTQWHSLKDRCIRLADRLESAMEIQVVAAGASSLFRCFLFSLAGIHLVSGLRDLRGMDLPGRAFWY